MMMRFMCRRVRDEGKVGVVSTRGVSKVGAGGEEEPKEAKKAKEGEGR